MFSRKFNQRREEVWPWHRSWRERRQQRDAIVDYEDKVFEDIQAEPGEKAFILMHTVPFEGSVAGQYAHGTRINRKGFDTHWCSTVPVR